MATLDELMRWLSTTNTPINWQTYLNNNIEKYTNTPEIANQFKVLSWLRNSALNDVRNNIIDSYNIFEQATNPAFRQYINTSLSQGNKILSEIDKQKADVEKFYWEWWTAQTMIDDYIVKYWNALTQQSAWNQALAKNTALKSWASTSAVRAAVTSQQQADASKLLEFQSKKVADLTNLYNTYTWLISQLRAEASTANQSYILQPLAQILDRQTQIASALVQNEATLNQMKLSTWTNTATTNNLSWLSELIKKYEADPDSLTAPEWSVMASVIWWVSLNPTNTTQPTKTQSLTGTII